MCYLSTRPAAFKYRAIRNEKDTTSFRLLASWIQLTRVFSDLPINFVRHSHDELPKEDIFVAWPIFVLVWSRPLLMLIQKRLDRTYQLSIKAKSVLRHLSCSKSSDPALNFHSCFYSTFLSLFYSLVNYLTKFKHMILPLYHQSSWILVSVFIKSVPEHLL